MPIAPHLVKRPGLGRGLVARAASAFAMLATASCSNAQPTDAPAPPPVATAPACAVAIPALSGRVTDLAEMMTADREAALSERLAALEARKGPQLFVVTVATLDGRAIDEFSLCHANHWGVGHKDVDDGVILLVAPKERRVRIEVGYGLEKALTDAEAQKVLDEVVLPRFLAQDFPGGIDAGADAIIKEIG